MRRRQPNIIVSSLAFVVVGCIPATYVEVPALRGRVVDTDGRPLANAVVQLVDFHGIQVSAVPTRADGTFSRPEQSNFTLQFLVGDFGVFPVFLDSH